jgi:hypothetical protein
MLTKGFTEFRHSIPAARECYFYFNRQMDKMIGTVNALK